MTSLGSFDATSITGETQPLAAYEGKVVLVVNVASKCGLTPQYEGLEQLYRSYRARGFTVLGFPCNQFLGQEPNSEKEIAEFCTLNFGVDFPMFGKIAVNGAEANPLYQWLKAATPESDDRDIEWNFAKFLIGRDGRPIRRYAPTVVPADIAADIEQAL